MNKIVKFFKSFLFIGIIVVLSGVILQLVFLNLWVNSIYQLIINIISNAALTVGVGLIIGYVMDMTKNSSEYISYIEERLQSTIISKKFIAELSQAKKDQIVEKCLTNDSTHQLLTEYVKYKSFKIRELCSGHLRSNIDYITTASQSGNTVKLRTVMCYKIYKVNKTYQNIKHVFGNSNSKLISLKITSPNKKVYNVPEYLLLVSQKTKNQNEIAYENSIEIPAHLANEKYLSVESVVEEYGFDHWAHLTWMSLYPTDGISYKIICNDNLIIKEHMIFDDPNGLFSTHAEVNDKNQITSYTIKCEEWTDPYTGFSLIISKP